MPSVDEILASPPLSGLRRVTRRGGNRQVVTVRLAEQFSDLNPAPPADSTGATVHQNLNAFQKVQQASGGVRFTAENVRLAGQLVMQSDKDAQAMADILRFLASMVQSNSQKNPTVGALASVLSALNLTTNANVTQVALAVPEAQVEQLLNTLQQQHRHAESPVAQPAKPAN